MTALLAFAARHWKLFGLVVLIGLLGVQCSRVATLKAEVADQKVTIKGVKAEREGWRASYRLSEDARAAERAEGIAAATEASSACDARVAEARRSARAIETIVTKEVPRDPQGCPRRELVPADQLRDALRPSD